MEDMKAFEATEAVLAGKFLKASWECPSQHPKKGSLEMDIVEAHEFLLVALLLSTGLNRRVKQTYLLGRLAGEAYGTWQNLPKSPSSDLWVFLDWHQYSQSAVIGWHWGHPSKIAIQMPCLSFWQEPMHCYLDCNFWCQVHQLPHKFLPFVFHILQICCRSAWQTDMPLRGAYSLLGLSPAAILPHPRALLQFHLAPSLAVLNVRFPDILVPGKMSNTRMLEWLDMQLLKHRLTTNWTKLKGRLWQGCLTVYAL